MHTLLSEKSQCEIAAYYMMPITVYDILEKAKLWSDCLGLAWGKDEQRTFRSVRRLYNTIMIDTH